MRRLSMPICTTLVLAGCTTTQQSPLYSDGGTPRPAEGTNQSLVFGPADGQAYAARNDPVAGRRTLYYGPNGHLYFEDGTAVQFKGVRHQLQDLRAEERINPVR